MTARRSNPRLRLIQLIHVGKQRLGMDDDTYRVLLYATTGASSSKDLCSADLERVLAVMKAQGFKVTSPRASRRKDDVPTSRMIRGLWLELHQAGVVHDGSEKALGHFVKRAVGVEALQWLSAAQARSVIEQLKQWRQRNVASQTR